MSTFDTNPVGSALQRLASQAVAGLDAPARLPLSTGILEQSAATEDGMFAESIGPKTLK